MTKEDNKATCECFEDVDKKSESVLLLCSERGRPCSLNFELCKFNLTKRQSGPTPSE